MITRVKALLLAVALCVTAHGTSLPFTRDTVTSQLTHHEGGGWTAAATAEAAAVRAAASGHSLGNLDKTVDKRTPSSAVEDWSLVCQQLCGAALGGAVCSPYCKNMPVLPPKVQIENANTLMDSKKQFICPQLCGLQLGDEVCTCKNWLADDYYSKSPTEKEERNICAIFCDQQHVALAGCSPCSTGNDTTENKNDSTSVTSMDNGQLISNAIVLAADAEENTTTTTTTTPDWNQLCASLCKTGDGGSLCNCDLSPFYV